MKILVVLLLILAMIVILVMLKTNNDLRFQLEQKQQEIDASAQYIELLTEQLVKTSNESHKAANRSDNMTDILKNYLSHDPEVDEKPDFETDRSNTFVPDRVPTVGDYHVSQTFKEEHRALDLAAALGTQVIASATGEVINIEEDKYFGNMLILDHFNGYITVYAHLAKTLAQKGSIVKKGNIIGLVGNTGNSTGPHLHFELIKDGTQLDPEKRINFK